MLNVELLGVYLGSSFELRQNFLDRVSFRMCLELFTVLGCVKTQSIICQMSCALSVCHFQQVLWQPSAGDTFNVVYHCISGHGLFFAAVFDMGSVVKHGQCGAITRYFATMGCDSRNFFPLQKTPAAGRAAGFIVVSGS